MNQISLYIPFPTPVLDYAESRLRKAGFAVTQDLTDRITHILLPIPSLDDTGKIRDGGDLTELLNRLPPNTTLIGGNLNHPAMEGQKVLDLLQDPGYLANNARITAYCTLKYLCGSLPFILPGRSVLIVGWGRIGKCLAKLLCSLEARVSISARKPEDRAMIQALGFTAVNCEATEFKPTQYEIVINTVPVPILEDTVFRDSCFLLDLASRKGIAGKRVIWARGLPGKIAPASSGALISETLVRLITGKELC